MSRRVVRVGVFLCVLPLALLAAWGIGNGLFAADDDPFGDGPAMPAGRDPFAPDTEKPAAGNPSADGSRAKTAKPGASSEAKPKSAQQSKQRSGEKAIIKALKEKTTFEFVETPLKDVIDYLSSKHRIPIQLDACGLKDAGVDPDTQVTKQLSGIPLQSALEIVLDELQLKWTIHHDVLLITSPQRAESDEFMYTKSYDVSDLVSQPGDFGINDNPLTAPGATPQSGNMGMMGQGGMGGMGLGSNVSSQSQAAPNLDEIKTLIVSTVSSKSWTDNGGDGTIAPYGRRVLVISQTREVHAGIERLLSDLRATRRATPMLAVELQWLWLDAAHRDKLLDVHASDKGDELRILDSRLLQHIAAEVPRFHANVGCINGVGTTIASGDRRTIIVGAIPVVGSGIGYSPVLSVPNIGITAEIRPAVAANSKNALLFVRSTITRRTPSRRPAIIGSAWPAEQGAHVAPSIAHTTPPSNPVVHMEKTESGSGSCPIDLPVMPTQEFGTTLRVPLGKPVVVGSVTFAPSGDAGLGEARVDPVEVYLIATTSLVKKPK